MLCEKDSRGTRQEVAAVTDKTGKQEGAGRQEGDGLGSEGQL